MAGAFPCIQELIEFCTNRLRAPRKTIAAVLVSVSCGEKRKWERMSNGCNSAVISDLEQTRRERKKVFGFIEIKREKSLYIDR